MGSPDRSPRLTGAQRRQAILDAAASLFTESSAEAVTMSDIVAAAGVSRPVVYDHFSTKSALIIALIERHHETMVSALEAMAQDGGVRDEQTYRAVLDATFERFESDPASWRLLCDEPSGDPAVAEVQRRTRDEVLTLTLAALPVPSGSLAVAEGLRTAINGLFGWGREHPAVSRQELVDAAVALTWRGLGSTEDADASAGTSPAGARAR